MRILYLCASPTYRSDSRSGYGAHLRMFTRHAREAGHEVELLVYGDTVQATGARIDQRGPRPTRTPSAGFRGLGRALLPRLVVSTVSDLKLVLAGRGAGAAVEAAIRRTHPEVLYERTSYLQRAGLVAARRHPLPYVLEINAPGEERVALAGRSLLTPLGRRLQRARLAAAQGTIVVSSALADYCRAIAPAGHPILVLPNACDPRLAAPRAKPTGTLRCGFVGSLFDWHGLAALVETFRDLPTGEPR